MKEHFDTLKLAFMAVYCSAVTAASFWYFFAITFQKVPEDNIQNSNLILGFLIGSAISTFLGYYFGTSQSAGSRPQDKIPPQSTDFVQTTTETTTASKKEP